MVFHSVLVITNGANRSNYLAIQRCQTRDLIFSVHIPVRLCVVIYKGLRFGPTQAKGKFSIDFGGTKISHMTLLNLCYIKLCVCTCVYNIYHKHVQMCFCIF